MLVNIFLVLVSFLYSNFSYYIVNKYITAVYAIKASDLSVNATFLFKYAVAKQNFVRQH